MQEDTCARAEGHERQNRLIDVSTTTLRTIAERMLRTDRRMYVSREQTADGMNDATTYVCFSDQIAVSAT